MIHVLDRKTSEDEIREMLEELGSYIKLAVDVRLGVLAGGGAMHSDCESALLQQGSLQENIWGADWVPVTGEIRFDSVINIRPRQGNRSMTIQDPQVRTRVESVIRQVFGASK